MKRKCKNGCTNKFIVYPNKLCQKCFSDFLEKKLIEKGRDLKLTSKQLITSYLIEEKSINQIAKDNLLKSFQVKKLLNEYRIPVKSTSASIQKKIDEKVFLKLNSESAYLLGYIFTDGNLILNKKNNTYFLQIYSKYKYQLENVRKILKTNATIQHRSQKNYSGKIQGEIFWVFIGNQKVINSLIKLGMITNKNQEIKFPKIPENLINHFIRGCWTGSGCVTMDGNTLLSQLTIGSLDFIKKIEEILNSKGLKKRNIYENKQSKKPSYVIRYATNESEKLYKYMYNKSSPLTTCKRQEKLFAEKFKN